MTVLEAHDPLVTPMTSDRFFFTTPPDTYNLSPRQSANTDEEDRVRPRLRLYSADGAKRGPGRSAHLRRHRIRTCSQ